MPQSFNSGLKAKKQKQPLFDSWATCYGGFQGMRLGMCSKGVVPHGGEFWVWLETGPAKSSGPSNTCSCAIFKLFLAQLNIVH